MNQDTKKCSYCKKTGHSVNECQEHEKARLEISLQRRVARIRRLNRPTHFNSIR